MKYRPAEAKYNKQHKGRRFNKVAKSEVFTPALSVSVVYLKVREAVRLHEDLIEMIRTTVKKRTKKYGAVRLSLLADTPVSKKPLEIRMGKGKGAINAWYVRLVPGSILVKIIFYKPIFYRTIKGTLEYLQKKLPIKTFIASK